MARVLTEDEVCKVSSYGVSLVDLVRSHEELRARNARQAQSIKDYQEERKQVLDIMSGRL